MSIGKPLWIWEELAAAAGGTADGTPEHIVTGFSIDSRTIAPDEVFVALKDQRDGHDFVTDAFLRGAAAALVAETYLRRSGDGALIRTADPLTALAAIGRAARARTRTTIFAVTGSVGKTGTKEALRGCLARLGTTHAAEKSFNNQWGVPLTLARMPSDAAFGVFEIGMNHAGEIAPLTRLVRPHVAIVTTVEPVHLAYFDSVEAIAEAKAEIFLGLEPGGSAILNRDNAHCRLLAARAAAGGARIVTFGRQAGADVHADVWRPQADGTDLEAVVFDRRVAYRVGAAGEHLALNSLAVVAALAAAGLDAARAVGAFADVRVPAGRGARTELAVAGGAVLLIDESYNANPASMRAALAALAMVPRTRFPRRVGVLGDMLELGPTAPDLHRGLREAIDAAGVDLVFACGSNMRLLFDDLPASQRGFWAAESSGLLTPLLATLRIGDAVMVKGSLGSRMEPLAAAIKILTNPPIE
ncbi:MAG: UDP-N-acetylmuramoylalanyl-D-glutamyl-2,6-diaminopimelate--D-alanyl-D-alanine ligase [Hyphomicrobiaceae bacterium]